MKDLISFKLKEERLDLIVENKSDVRVEGLENELIQVLINIITNFLETFKRKNIKDNSNGMSEDMLSNNY